MYYGFDTNWDNFLKADVKIIGFVEGADLQQLPIDKTISKALQTLSQTMNKARQVRSIYTDSGQHIMLIHCGKQAEFTQQSLQKIIKSMFSQDGISEAETIHVHLPAITDLTEEQMATQLLIQTDYQCYAFNQFKSKEDKRAQPNSTTIQFFGLGAEQATIEKATALINGIRLARDLGNTPANICTPNHLAETAQHIADQFAQVQCHILDKVEMKELGMNLLLSVGQGSVQEPRLIELQYHNGGDQAPLVFVGKGITFDAGGYTLKPGNAMEEMKYDMCGAASVLGIMRAVAEAKLPINVIGVVAAAENLISGQATKPGDVFTAMSGKTVEVINTDAEGRLVLADALTYVSRFNPACVIDIATLTGAMVIALGDVYTGIFSPDDQLADQILEASAQTQDLCWRFPLHEDYAQILDSQIADIANASWDRSAGSITAAWFLSHFSKDYRWAHCDIAGTAWISGKKRNATGRPVPMLFQFIENHIAHEKS